jgi:hypothetical protein
MDKHRILERLKRERDPFEQLINRAGFARRLTTKGVSGVMSVKDILAVVLSHEQFILDRLGEILHDEVYSPCDSIPAIMTFHDKFGYPDYGSPLVQKVHPQRLVAEKYKNIPLDEIASHEIQTYGAILNLLDKLPAWQWTLHDLFRTVPEHTYKQYHRYGIEIQAWLKANVVRTKG